MAENPAPIFPPNLGARAVRDYAHQDRQEHRTLVRRLLDGGIRTNAGLAQELNRLDAIPNGGRPWDAGRAGRLLRRLRLRWETWAQQDAEAIREPVEDLWLGGYRARPQLAIALNRRRIASPDGRPWTASRAGRLIARLGLDWSDSNVRLRRGMEVPELAEVAELPPERIEVPEVPEAAELSEVAEQKPRRRAIRS